MSNSETTRRFFLKRLGSLLAAGGLVAVKAPLALASQLAADLGKLAGDVITRTHGTCARINATRISSCEPNRSRM
jgi:hypothetical protein